MILRSPLLVQTTASIAFAACGEDNTGSISNEVSVGAQALDRVAIHCVDSDTIGAAHACRHALEVVGHVLGLRVVPDAGVLLCIRRLAFVKTDWPIARHLGQIFDALERTVDPWRFAWSAAVEVVWL